MIKVVTSIGLFGDAVGQRMSITYSEIDEKTGQVITDNKRVDKVVLEQNILAEITDIKNYAQEFIDAED